MKVVVGMSGGVDSAVSAYILKEKGYEVHGIWIRMTENEKEMQDAKRVADYLQIPFAVVDRREFFLNNIKCYFIDAYRNAQTPNPCVQCNPSVKWNAMLTYADEIGAEYVATGHYARIGRLFNGRLTICNSATAEKDQTYVLCRLTQAMLFRTLMPLGEYTKTEVRNIASKVGIPVADKSDSQDICFIPDGDYYGFLQRECPEKLHGAGEFVNEAGTVLGKHKGIEGYTIGQRKGLGVAVGHPVYVKKLLPEENKILLSEEDVFDSEMFVTDVHFVGMERNEITDDIEFNVRVRYAHKGTRGTVRFLSGDVLQVTFEQPVRAITPGQAAVFDLDGSVMFSGRILGNTDHESDESKGSDGNQATLA